MREHWRWEGYVADSLEKSQQRCHKWISTWITIITYMFQLSVQKVSLQASKSLLLNHVLRKMVCAGAIHRYTQISIPLDIPRHI